MCVWVFRVNLNSSGRKNHSDEKYNSNLSVILILHSYETMIKINHVK